jgi:iron complex outermembrane recepter protein
MHSISRFFQFEKSAAVMLLGFVLMAWPVPGLADDPEDAQSSQGETEAPVFKLDDVVIRGDLSQKNLEATSTSVLTSEQIADRVYENPLEIVGQVPGVSFKQYKQGGTASSLQMRGFTRISHGSDAAIYLDGIPLNEGDGYADTNVVNPEELERVEVIKGPVSPLYGNYASAGVLHFYTKKKVENQHVKLLYGDYNTYEGNYVGGFTSKDGKTDHVYSAMAYHTDGYQDNSDWDKLNAAARITHRFTDDFKARISLRGFNSDWDAPGWLNREQYETNPSQSANDTNAGSKDLLSGKADLEYMLTADSKILFSAFNYKQNFKRYYAGSEEGLAPGTVVGNLRDFDRRVYGAGGSYNYVGDVFGRQLSFTAGSDYMLEQEGRQRWRLTAGNGRNKGAKYVDYEYDFHSLGFYTDINYQIIDPLKVILGARYDYFTGELTDHLLNDEKSSMESTTIFSPKGGLLLSLLDDRLEFLGNYSRGFAIMSGFAEQAQFTQDQWDPQIRTQYELGIRVRPFDWFSAQLIGWRLDTSDDFIQDPATLEYQNAGETQRKGFDLSLDFYAFEHGYLQANYTYTDAKYEDFTINGISYNGKYLPSVPDDIVNIELGYSPPKGIGGWLRYRYESAMYLDMNNTLKSESWNKVDTSLFYRFGTGAKYRLGLEVTNIFDQKYAATTSHWGGRTSYSPGLPRSFYASLTVDF